MRDILSQRILVMLHDPAPMEQSLIPEITTRIIHNTVDAEIKIEKRVQFFISQTRCLAVSGPVCLIQHCVSVK